MVLPVLQELRLPRRFLSLAAWTWAASTLMSRTMYLPFDLAGALTPFGDLANYQPPAPPFTPNILNGLPTPSIGTAASIVLPVVEQSVSLASPPLGEGDGAEVAASADGGPVRDRGAANDESRPSLPDPCNGDGEAPSGDWGDGHYDASAGVYRLVARRRYDVGDQVFLCYGRHTNLELLEHYGFMLDDNPHGGAGSLNTSAS